MGAAGGEGAAWGAVEHGGDFAGEGGFAGSVGVGAGDGVEEGLGVGVLGVGVEGLAGGDFDDGAGVHDGDVVGHGADDGEVVGDEEVAEAEAVLQVKQEVDDLGLHGDVEGGDGFVGDDEIGAECEGAGDADALALAAGEFVGVAVGGGLGEADHVEEFGDAAGAFGAGEAAFDVERFGDGVADAHAGVEGAVGVLEDELEAVADGGEVLGSVGAGDGLVEEGDVTGGGGDEADEEAAGGGFAGAGFADEAEGFAGCDGEADVVDGAKGAVVTGGEVLDQVCRGDDGAGHVGAVGDSVWVQCDMGRSFLLLFFKKEGLLF